MHSDSRKKLSVKELIRLREQRAKAAGLPEGSQMDPEFTESPSPAERGATAARRRARSRFTSGSVDFSPKASDQADGLEGMNRRAIHEPGMASRMRRKRRK